MQIDVTGLVATAFDHFDSRAVRGRFLDLQEAFIEQEILFAVCC